MDYLLLCSKTQPDLFTTGYDFNHYPMGKVGNRFFESKDVLDKIMFLAGDTRSIENEKTLLYNIVNRIKFYIQETKYQYYNGDDEYATDKNSSFFDQHWLAISLSAGAGLSAGIGLGLAMGVFHEIPTGGASIIATTPFAVLILGAVGFVIGLVAGIIGNLVVDNWSTTEPDDPHGCHIKI